MTIEGEHRTFQIDMSVWPTAKHRRHGSARAAVEVRQSGGSGQNGPYHAPEQMAKLHKECGWMQDRTDLKSGCSPREYSTNLLRKCGWMPDRTDLNIGVSVSICRSKRGALPPKTPQDLSQRGQSRRGPEVRTVCLQRWPEVTAWPITRSAALARQCPTDSGMVQEHADPGHTWHTE